MKYCSKLYFHLKKFDIYGYKFPLRYQSESSYSTPYGLFFSLISFFFIITIIIRYTIKIFINNSYSVITTTMNREKLPELNFENNPFMFGIIKYGISQKLDPRILKIILDRNIHIPIKNENNFTVLNRTSYSIELEECNLNHFKNYKSLFLNYDYEKYLCPKSGQNLTFRGRYGDQIKGYDILEMHLIKCENDSKYNNCKSEKEINDFLENSFVSLIYLSNFINHENISNPVLYFLQSDAFAVSTDKVKRYYYFFSKEKYISDKGFFFDEIKKIDLFRYQYTLMDFVNKESQSFYSSQTLIEINFSCVEIETEYLRTYLKLIDVFGIIGGWKDIVVSIFNFISYYFSKKTFSLELCNSLMSHNFHRMITKRKFDYNNKKKNKQLKGSTAVLIYKIKSLSKMNNYVIKDTNFFNKNLINNKKNNSDNKDIKNNNSNNINNNSNSNINIINNKNNNMNNINNNDNSIRSSSSSSKIQKMNDIQNFKLNKKKSLCFYFQYYLFPFCFIENNQTYQLYRVYTKIYHKFMSIDLLIPLVLNHYISNDINKKN